MGSFCYKDGALCTPSSGGTGGHCAAGGCIAYPPNNPCNSGYCNQYASGYWCTSGGAWVKDTFLFCPTGCVETVWYQSQCTSTNNNYHGSNTCGCPTSSSSAAPVCGDGIKNGTEECDAGANNVDVGIANMAFKDTDTQLAELTKSGCLKTCKLAKCSNTIDDDNANGKDAADPGCKSPKGNTYMPGYNIEQCPCNETRPAQPPPNPPVAQKSFFNFFKNLTADGAKATNAECNTPNATNLNNDDCQGIANYCKYASGGIGTFNDAVYKCKPLQPEWGPCSTARDCIDNYPGGMYDNNYSTNNNRAICYDLNNTGGICVNDWQNNLVQCSGTPPRW